MNKGAAVKIVDDSTFAITADWEKCIGCQSCVRACSNISGMGVYSTVKVGIPPYVVPRYPARKHSNVVKLDLDNIHMNKAEDRVQISNSNCIGCGQCSLACPVSAIKPYDGDLADTLSVLRAKMQSKEGMSQNIKCVAFVAPSVRIGISELAGLPVGTSVPRQLANALRACGFDYVFDVDWGADLTTVVDTEDVVKARETHTNRPIFTSCCPAWINMAENRYPWLLNHISRACSCVEMAARCVRQYITKKYREEVQEERRRNVRSSGATQFSASTIISDENGKDTSSASQKSHHEDSKGLEIFIVDIMPCTAKKQEARRIEGAHRDRATGETRRNIDACLTVPELYRLIKTLAPERLPFDDRDESEYPPMDSPMASHMTSTGSTQYARTAGVAENVLRQISFMKTGNPMAIYETLAFKTIWQPYPDNEHIGIKSMNCIIAGEEYTAYVAKGGVACIKAVEMLKDNLLSDVDVVEMMTCPGGCLGGGGMPKIKPSEFSEVLTTRITGIRKLDHQISNFDGRVGGQNEHQKNFIRNFLSTPELLAASTLTKYVPWDERTGKTRPPSPPPSPEPAAAIGSL